MLTTQRVHKAHAARRMRDGGYYLGDLCAEAPLQCEILQADVLPPSSSAESCGAAGKASQSPARSLFERLEFANYNAHVFPTCSEYCWNISVRSVCKIASGATGTRFSPTVKLYKRLLAATSSRVQCLMSELREAPVTPYQGQPAPHTLTPHLQPLSSNCFCAQRELKATADSYSLFNLERILLASFLMSAIKSSSSAFVSARRGDRRLESAFMRLLISHKPGRCRYTHTPRGSRCHLQQRATFYQHDYKDAHLALREVYLVL